MRVVVDVVALAPEHAQPRFECPFRTIEHTSLEREFCAQFAERDTGAALDDHKERVEILTLVRAVARGNGQCINGWPEAAVYKGAPTAEQLHDRHVAIPFVLIGEVPRGRVVPRVAARVVMGVPARRSATLGISAWPCTSNSPPRERVGHAAPARGGDRCGSPHVRRRYARREPLSGRGNGSIDFAIASGLRYVRRLVVAVPHPGGLSPDGRSTAPGGAWPRSTTSRRAPVSASAPCHGCSTAVRG